MDKRLGENISIPTGTIKRKMKATICELWQTFQFLLVRLKDYLNNFKKAINLISIPTGTIKRFLFISIWLVQTLFQFLLVRLKESNIIQTTLQIFNFNSYWYD